MFKDGKMKAITFSYDDGITQDRRIIKIFNKYGLKCTFNLNSGLLGTAGLINGGITVAHVKPRPDEVKELYAGHEVAAHTVSHPMLPALDDSEILHQVEDDRAALESITGEKTVGMAYPGGGENHDERVVRLLRDNTDLKYCRTIISNYSFEPQSDLLRFNPTVYHMEFEKMLKLAKSFLELKTDTPKIFYIWGHSYELDYNDTWDDFERFCEYISGRDDIFYGTNKEVLL